VNSDFNNEKKKNNIRKHNIDKLKTRKKERKNISKPPPIFKKEIRKILPQIS